MPVQAVGQSALAAQLLGVLTKTNNSFATSAQEVSSGEKSIGNISIGNLFAGLKALSDLGGFQAQSSGLQISQSSAAFAQSNLSLANDTVNNIQSLTAQLNSGFGDDATNAAISSAISAEVQSLGGLLGPNLTPFGGGGEIQLTDDSADILTGEVVTQINGASSENFDVDVTINSVGAAATTTLTTPGTANSFTLNGVTINYDGSGDAALAAAINATTEQTGVTATAGAGSVTLDQETAGTANTISIQDVQGGQFGAGETGIFAGTDASVTVNSVTVTGNGNDISFTNAGGVTGSFTIDDTVAAAGDTTTFTTQGGGTQLYTGSGTVTVASPGLSSLQNFANDPASFTFDEASTIIGGFQDSLLATQSQIAGIQGTQNSAQNQFQTQISSLSVASNDLLGADFASGVTSLLSSVNQQQLQLALIAKNNALGGGLLKLLKP
ncbi:MAG: hypothetical protein HUU29_00145 [Planctomycetaceae bacterium]|nr:hypothetical protein [Planctomycetaceae bacterium]